MNLTPDDPRLTAYLLGELPPAEAAAVERAIAADPALQLAFGDVKKVASFLEGSLSTATPALRPAQREAVLRAGRHADAEGRVVELPSARQTWRPWLATAGAAAAVVLALTIAAKLAGPTNRVTSVDDGASQISLLPMPGPHTSGEAAVAGGGSGAKVELAQQQQLRSDPASFLDNVSRQLRRDPLPDPARLPTLKPLPALQSEVEIKLPVVIGQASYGWVRGWIRERGQLPPKSAVRIEELVNTFPLPIEETEKISSTIETAVCPWDAGRVLVAATLRAPKGAEIPTEWSFEAGKGMRVRMLASTGMNSQMLPDRLPGGRMVTVLLEVEPGKDSDRLGVLKLDAGGDFSGTIVKTPEGEISPAMRQLGLIASFGMWLRAEGIDDDQMAALLLNSGTDEDPGRADTRQLVRQALDIATAGR